MNNASYDSWVSFSFLPQFYDEVTWDGKINLTAWHYQVIEESPSFSLSWHSDSPIQFKSIFCPDWFCIIQMPLEYWQAMGIGDLPWRPTSPGSVFQCLTYLTVKIFFLMFSLNLCWCSFVFFPCVPMFIGLPVWRDWHLPLHLLSSGSCRDQSSLVSTLVTFQPSFLQT